MPEFEFLIEITEKRKVRIDADTVEEAEQSLATTFPDWANDDCSEYQLWSLCYEVINKREVKMVG